MGIFLAFTTLEGSVQASAYPVVYAVKIAAVSIALAGCRRHWMQEFRPTWSAAGLAVGAGLAGFGLWIALDAWTPHFAFLGARAGFNPFERIADPGSRAVFIALRLYGMAILVPVMEELFWRSFMLRYVTNPDQWWTLPIGKFSPTAVGISTLLFSTAHPEWLAAIAFALLMTWLCRRTGSLFSGTLAHAITNLALAIYVLVTGHWAYW
jgi:CAAX prenyl protease-like protein